MPTSPAPLPSPLPTPAPVKAGFDLKLVLSSVLRGVWAAVEHSPVLGVLLVLLLVSVLVRSVRNAIHSGHPKDGVRRFSQDKRRLIFARAGQRCEHHGLLLGRCRVTTGLEADHVHPHSRGGQTSISNGQALCRGHNRAKSARVPWNWQLNRLAQQRASYAPPHPDPIVVRYRPAKAALSAPHAGGEHRRHRPTASSSLTSPAPVAANSNTSAAAIAPSFRKRAARR